MKEFNLEKAKTGKPVCTREGRKARIICWDRKGEYPIVALIESEREVFPERVEIYSMAGECRIGSTSSDDLMMAPEKHEGWENVCKGFNGQGEIRWTEGKIYDTKEEAEKMALKAGGYVTTIKIEWEE